MMTDESIFNKIYESWNVSNKSIKDAEKYIEDEATDAKIKLNEKFSEILKSIHDNKPVNTDNVLSEAVLIAWDLSYDIKYNEFKKITDILQWATVDVTNERNFLTEMDLSYDISGIDGETYKNGDYKESSKNLENNVKKLDKKIKEVKNNLWGRLIGRIAYFVIGSIALWSVTILKYSELNSPPPLYILLILEPIAIYLLVIFFVVGFMFISKIFFGNDRKKNRKKT